MTSSLLTQPEESQQNDKNNAILTRELASDVSTKNEQRASAFSAFTSETELVWRRYFAAGKQIKLQAGLNRNE